MALKNLSDHQAHRALAQKALKSAADAVEVEVASVGFGDRKQDEDYFMALLVVHPASLVLMTMDHAARIFPA